MRNNKDNDNLISLQSQENLDNNPNFIQAKNDRGKKDSELNDLIHELEDDRSASKEI